MNIERTESELKILGENLAKVLNIKEPVITFSRSADFFMKPHLTGFTFIVRNQKLIIAEIFFGKTTSDLFDKVSDRIHKIIWSDEPDFSQRIGASDMENSLSVTRFRKLVKEVAELNNYFLPSEENGFTNSALATWATGEDSTTQPSQTGVEMKSDAYGQAGEAIKALLIKKLLIEKLKH